MHETRGERLTAVSYYSVVYFGNHAHTSMSLNKPNNDAAGLLQD